MYKNKKLIIKGHQNPTDGLWDVPLEKPLPPQKQKISPPSPPNIAKSPSSDAVTLIKLQVNAIFCQNKTKSELATYHHATCCSPPIKTFFNAITNRNFILWPGIELICRKDIPDSKATAQGHLDQERNRSTIYKRICSLIVIAISKA